MRPTIPVFVAMVLTLAVQASGRPAASQPARDWAKLDACRLVPGEGIARALGGKLTGTRPFADKSVSRCTYFVVPAGREKPLGYTVWLQAAADFEELKKYIDDPISPVNGLGDAAYLFHDKGDGRFKIHVLKRGDLMFEATGESAESARKVAEAVVAQLWAKGR